MYLEKLEIQGFKSFANKTELTFKTKGKLSRITAIVGPNGCGKSNIADAIRWVMGEQSMKLLRGKRFEDVIFSGSGKKARLGMAEVSLYLNNEDKSFPIDYSQIVITRRLYRSGESEYLINNNKVRLFDIQLLLAKAHFGQRTYSVIGQGMIENILISSPADRKIFFDEAVGVKEFQIKREQSIHKLESTLKNITQAEALIAEIKPRLTYLTRQVNRLKKQQTVKEKLKAVQLDYYSYLLHNFEKQRKSLEQKYSKLESNKNKQQSELDQIQKKLKQLEKEEGRSQVFERLQNEYDELLKKKNSLLEQELHIKNKIELQKRIAVKTPILKSLDEIVYELERFRSEQYKLFKKLFASNNLQALSQLKKELEKYQNNFSMYVENLKTISTKKTQETKSDPQLITELKSLQKEISTLNNQLQEVQTQIRALNKKEEQKKGDFFSLQREFQKKQFEFNQTTAQVNEINIELTRVATRKEDLENEIQQEKLVLKELISHTVKQKLDTAIALEQIKKYKHQLELIGGIDEETVTEYNETKDRYDNITAQIKDLKKASNNLEKVIEELDQNIKKIFDKSFKTINDHFQKYFKILFGGGRASLVLQKEKPIEQKKTNELINKDIDQKTEPDSQQDVQEISHQRNESIIQYKEQITGVEIYATPPGKKIKNIHILSGGERALTAIALICAIISVNPSPFVLLDEVDAALDEANSERFSRIINELAQKTQFITITHNRATMHNADILYGITMGDDGISRLLSLHFEDLKK